ncbi:mRNA splicing protein PRP18 [Aspergillus clavatus NRRL 1]|uniref:Pre-mRNA-splicing factor 18 n=1 Tax=Aspergillus clavatus (strain ATCC 1007 / CBS 513.65 / DSM 816 / NCTC 3887 / NRRL 1 / QM 1276 / 107) TaxID=344612 RepID=A1CNC7_ASPCL|nr:mRNA splicing factor (Prp18), putative [Aspergillus clavatus NRRL 1]EAW07148.1 mRNA splicing factor (Prp18), putative [Aspergillus clavatus NRRL 1]
MDFASLMAKEISKAKSPAVPSSSSASEQKELTKAPEKKYVRRADLEAARIAAYSEEQERLQREREERQAQKRKHEEEEADRRREREEKKRRLAEESKKKREEEEFAKERERRKRLGLPELPPPGDKDGKTSGEEEDIPDEELNQKLRDLKEPICYFGENHVARLRRYRRLVRRSQTPQPKITNGPIPTTLEPVPEVDMKIPTTLPKDAEGRKFLFRQLGSYFNMVLSEWEYALSKRDISVKQSLTGRQAYNAMVQSRENLKPLFRKFEKNDLDDNLLEPIMEIVHKAQLRRYVDANDAYLRVSIGKAAWPIGVTMVGIHERSAREKLHQSDQQAHILSDEMTRKFLQSIKRCLSYAQTRWPPDDQLQIMG